MSVFLAAKLAAILFMQAPGDYFLVREAAFSAWNSISSEQKRLFASGFRKFLASEYFSSLSSQHLWDGVFLHYLTGEMPMLEQQLQQFPHGRLALLRKKASLLVYSDFRESLQHFPWPESSLDRDTQRLSAFQEMRKSLLLFGLK